MKGSKADSMRLAQSEIEAICEAFDATFSVGEVILFGSRTDDTKKGGDIDLYLKVPKEEATQQKKVDFLVRLRQKIYNKIDVVFAKDPTRPIEQAAQKGILLYRKERDGSTKN